MQPYDIIMLIVLLATTFIGFRKGLAWQVASIAAIVVSYIVAVRFRDVVAGYIDTSPPWNIFLAMLILYIATSLVIWIAFQMIRGAIDRAKLKEFDRQLGALFGLAKGVVLCIVITLFSLTLLTDGMRKQIMGSHSGLYIARLLDESHAIMPEELHEVLHPYLHELDIRFEEPPPERGFGEVEDELEQLDRWLEDAQQNLSGGLGQLGAPPPDATQSPDASSSSVPQRQRRYQGFR